MEVSMLLDEILQNTMEIGSWLWVGVTHINNPHSFYVLPRAYSKYMPMLQAKGDQPIASEVKLGDVVVYESQILQDNVRGKLIRINNVEEKFTFDLFAIDNGCTEIAVPLEKIWKPRCGLQVPSLISHCQLAHCLPVKGTWDDEAATAMRKFVENERAKMIIRNKACDILVVELYNSCPDDIATMLAYIDCCTLGYNNSVINVLESVKTEAKVVPNVLESVKTEAKVVPMYTPRVFEVGAVLHVRLISGTLYEKFYVAQVDDYKSYLKDRNDFTIAAKTERPISVQNLKLNAPIGVLDLQYNKYERGLVKEIIPSVNKAKVQLVDRGNIVEEHVSKLKPISNFFLHHPARAFCCTLEDTMYMMILKHTLVIQQLSRFGSEFLITIKESGNDESQTPYVVSLTRLTT